MPRAIKNDAKSTLLVLFQWNNTAQTTTYLLTTWFTEYCKSTVETTAQKKYIYFQNITAL